MNHHLCISLPICCLVVAGVFCFDLSANSADADIAGTEQSSLRIGIVNVNRIIDAHPEIKRPNDAALHTISMKPPARETEKLFERDYFVATREVEARRLQFRAREKNKLFERIHVAVVGEAEAQRLDLVLDSSAMSVGDLPFVLHTSGPVDLTEQILRTVAN